jgi:hypothetical protein
MIRVLARFIIEKSKKVRRGRNYSFPFVLRKFPPSCLCLKNWPGSQFLKVPPISLKNEPKTKIIKY